MKPNLRDQGVEILEDYRVRTMLKSFGYDQVDAVESSVRAFHVAHTNFSTIPLIPLHERLRKFRHAPQSPDTCC